jgi:UDP-N-acetylmuramate dehydrogenase
LHLQENIPLAPLTTLGVGGPARYFIEAASVDDVRAAVIWAHERGVPLFVLGGGSNLVVADAGFPGLALKIALRGIERRRENGQMLFTAAAGEDWDRFVAHAVASDCAGVECLSGIPGTVGATPVQNVGAYGHEVADTISEVQVLDRNTGELRVICNPGCEFGYRSSIFNSSATGRYIILAVTFALEPGGAPHLEYADLKNFFAGRGAPTLAEARAAVRQIRFGKAMLISPGDEDCRSAGSFFKNPVLNAAQYDELKTRLAAAGLGEVPHWLAANGKTKVSAAWLVEHAGFSKGFRRDAVGLSRKHALAMVNRGGATAAEIIALKDAIQAAVRQRFGVDLHPEPVFIGF